MITTRLKIIVPALLLLSVLVGYVVYPVGVMVRESLMVGDAISLRNYFDLVSDRTGNLEGIWNSVYVSVLSVIFSGIIGVLLAVVFTQIDFPLRKTLARLAVLPIALPPLVGVIAFLFVFGETGILPRLVQWVAGTATAPFSLDGLEAIVAIHTYSFYVYFYLFVSTGLRQLDGSILEASANLGSTPWRTFYRVILPELRPALLGASVLTFMTSMASFSAPFLFAGERRFMTLQIYNAKLNGEMDIASAQAVGLLIISVVFFAALKWSDRTVTGQGRSKGAVRPGRIQLGKGTRFVLTAIALTIVAVELLPILTIILVSFAKEGSWTWQIFPSEYTFGNYAKLLDDPSFFEPIRNSIFMTMIAVIVSLVVGVSAAYLSTKGGLQRSRVLVDLVATLPFAIPGTVVAISLILAFNTPNVFSGYNVLVGTFWILPLAYVVRMFPLVTRSTAASLERLDDSLLEAGKSFGAGAIRRFRKIALPLILPGIVSGALLIMITALGEFVSSILLYTYSNRPIAVEILSQLRTFDFGAAAAYSVFLLVVILLLTYLAGEIVKRYTPGRERLDF